MVARRLLPNHRLEGSSLVMQPDVQFARGGVSRLGMDKLIAEQTGLPVHVADDPLSAVAEGTGIVLNELNFLRKVASKERSY